MISLQRYCWEARRGCLTGKVRESEAITWPIGGNPRASDNSSWGREIYCPYSTCRLARRGQRKRWWLGSGPWNEKLHEAGDVGSQGRIRDMGRMGTTLTTHMDVIGFWWSWKAARCRPCMVKSTSSDPDTSRITWELWPFMRWGGIMVSGRIKLAICCTFWNKNIDCHVSIAAGVWNRHASPKMMQYTEKSNSFRYTCIQSWPMRLLSKSSVHWL